MGKPSGIVKLRGVNFIQKKALAKSVPFKDLNVTFQNEKFYTNLLFENQLYYLFYISM